METIKNFLVGLLVALVAIIILAVGIMLWPFLLGIGSLLVFMLVVALSIVLAFYVVVIIGQIVRKGVSSGGKK